MRLHILSDLHLELGTLKLPRTNADVVVLAGDIHLGQKGLVWAARHFAGTPVIYVLGNHECYGHSIPELTEKVRASKFRNLHFLENDALSLGGYTFLGCTLWTDFKVHGHRSAAMLSATIGIQDYRVIKMAENRLLLPSDSARMNASSLTWLKSQMSRLDPARTIIVTHHAPSVRSIPPEHSNSPLNGAFVSAFDRFVKMSGVPLWIHGHTHYNVDFKLGATRIISNQRGYPDDLAPGFCPGLVIDI